MRISYWANGFKQTLACLRCDWRTLYETETILSLRTVSVMHLSNNTNSHNLLKQDAQAVIL